MHSELSGVIVDELEAFEVNPVTFQSLEKAFAEVSCRKITCRKTDCRQENLFCHCDFQRSSLPVRKVNLHNSAFTAQTALIEKYHIMTLSHVLYYFTTPSQRRDVLKHLCSHLQEGGTLVILHSGKSKSDDVPDHQIMLSSTFGPRIDKGDGKAFLPADWSLYDGEQILQETENLLPSGIKASCQQYRYDVCKDASVFFQEPKNAFLYLTCVSDNRSFASCRCRRKEAIFKHHRLSLGVRCSVIAGGMLERSGPMGR